MAQANRIFPSRDGAQKGPFQQCTVSTHSTLAYSLDPVRLQSLKQKRLTEEAGATHKEIGVHLEKYKVIILVDSGSSTSFISEQLANQLSGPARWIDSSRFSLHTFPQWIIKASLNIAQLTISLESLVWLFSAIRKCGPGIRSGGISNNLAYIIILCLTWRYLPFLRIQVEKRRSTDHIFLLVLVTHMRKLPRPPENRDCTFAKEVDSLSEQRL